MLSLSRVIGQETDTPRGKAERWCLAKQRGDAALTTEPQDRIKLILTFYVSPTYLFIYFFVFWGCTCGTEFPRLELKPPAYSRATATQDLSHVCDLHHSSRQHQILNPRSKARDQTLFLMDTSWIRLPCATRETPYTDILTELGPERAGEERTS